MLSRVFANDCLLHQYNIATKLLKVWRWRQPRQPNHAECLMKRASPPLTASPPRVGSPRTAYDVFRAVSTAQPVRTNQIREKLRGIAFVLVRAQQSPNLPPHCASVEAPELREFNVDLFLDLWHYRAQVTLSVGARTRFLSECD